MTDSSSSSFATTASYSSLDTSGASAPFLELMLWYMRRTLAQKEPSVLLWRFDTAIRAASCA